MKVRIVPVRQIRHSSYLMAELTKAPTTWSNAGAMSSPVLATINETYDEFDWRSSDDVQHVTNALSTIVMPIVCLIGSIGSSVGMAVVFRTLRKKKGATFYYIYLLSLFTFDTLYLFYGAWVGILTIVAIFDSTSGSFLRVYRLKYHPYFTNMIFQNSAFVILIISLQRLLALVKPHVAKDMCLTKYPLKFILASFAFNVIFCSPYLMLKDVKKINLNNNSTLYVVEDAGILPNTGIMIYGIAVAVIYRCLELVLALIFNFGIVFMLVKIARQRKRSGMESMSGVERRQRKMTYTTLTILFLFILLLIPAIVGNALTLTDRQNSSKQNRTTFSLLYVIRDAFCYLNCSLDFPVYILTTGLQKDLLKPCCCYRNPKEQHVDQAESAQQTGLKLSIINTHTGGKRPFLEP